MATLASRPRAMQSTSIGDRHLAGDMNAHAARARVCWCTSVADVVAGEHATFTLHLPPKPELPPNWLRPPKVCVQVLREQLKTPGAPPQVEFDASQQLVRTAPTMRLRYGPLHRAGPYLLAVTIDGAHVAGSPFLLTCRPAPPVGELSSFDERQVGVRAGEVAVLLITTRDRYSNRCTYGGARVSVHDASPEEDADRLAQSALPAPGGLSPSERVVYHEMMLGAGEAIGASAAALAL